MRHDTNISSENQLIGINLGGQELQVDAKKMDLFPQSVVILCYHRVLIRTQCEWILYESCHKFFMKASRILYQTVTNSLQCWCARLKRSGNGNYGHIYSHVLLKNVYSVYFYLCMLFDFLQVNQLVKNSKI